MSHLKLETWAAVLWALTRASHHNRIGRSSSLGQRTQVKLLPIIIYERLHSCACRHRLFKRAIGRVMFSDVILARCVLNSRRLCF